MGTTVRECADTPAPQTAWRTLFESLARRFHAGVCNYLCWLSRDAALAEDLTQETFLASINELKKGRRVEAPIPWIYGIARHKLLDHYRKQARSERVVDPGAEVDDLPVDAGDEHARELTIAALAVVPAAQRAALVLCYMDGFSAAEVATELGKSIAAVHSLLERGRARFKHAYLEGSA